MPLSRTQKEDLVSSYQESMVAAPHAFLVDYAGVSVPQVTELRNKVRDSGGQYIVVKNRLLLRAIEGTAFENLKEHLQGPVAVAYSQTDPVALAKALSDFAKEVPALEFRAGLVEGQAVEASDIEAIAQLPSREELLTKLVYLLQSPISRLARTLGGITQQFVTVLHQVAQEKSNQEG